LPSGWPGIPWPGSPGRWTKRASRAHPRPIRTANAHRTGERFALEPILDGTPLPLRTWAKMIGSEERPCSSQSASLAFDTMVDYNLITRTNKGRTVIVAPRLQDGSGADWDNPGSNPATIGKGYLTISHAYWTTGLVDRLIFPGEALFLIMLSETTKDRSFAMAAERAPSWYGISERTAERCYKELREQETAGGVPLLLEHSQYRRAPSFGAQREMPCGASRPNRKRPRPRPMKPQSVSERKGVQSEST
jgi:hypothetical protein